MTHYPVMHREVLEIYRRFLKPEKKLRFLDGTAGEGGHAEKVLKAFPNSELLLIDRDEEMLERAKLRIGNNPQVFTRVKNFSELTKEDLSVLGWEDGFDGVLLDLGISTYHIKESGRGFSYRGSENLDMRLTRSIWERNPSAYDVVNTYPAKELERIFYQYGEEKWTKKIVEKIAQRRRTNPIRTNAELAKLVESTIPRKFWPPKTHPSIRVFQAIRIEVNQELYHLEKGIRSLPFLLSPGGVFSVISFHSLEDRIVKHGFRTHVTNGDFYLVTKKPILPLEDEVRENPPSRSAKLRCIIRNDSGENR